MLLSAELYSTVPTTDTTDYSHCFLLLTLLAKLQATMLAGATRLRRTLSPNQNLENYIQKVHDRCLQALFAMTAGQGPLSLMAEQAPFPSSPLQVDPPHWLL